MSKDDDTFEYVPDQEDKIQINNNGNVVKRTGMYQEESSDSSSDLEDEDDDQYVQ